MLKVYTEVIDADLSKYFDTIPHANLMTVVAERICDGAILSLIQMWLKAPVMEMDKDGRIGTSAAAKATTKATTKEHRKAGLSHHCWPIFTCYVELNITGKN